MTYVINGNHLQFPVSIFGAYTTVMRFILFTLLFIPASSFSQLSWQKKDSLFGPLPASVHVYYTASQLDGKPFRAWYVEADLQDRELIFTTDTTLQRRKTPQEFYERNDGALVVMNTTFFSFATQQNLNAVITAGKMVGYNVHSLAGRGKDTLTYRHPFTSAIGISKGRQADIAWLYTDSSRKYPYAMQRPLAYLHDSAAAFNFRRAKKYQRKKGESRFKKWKMQTAVGGGPVLVQNGQVLITNNEELKFAGKAINDKHPRTAMGYTADGRLILLAVEGRNPGTAEGADLVQLANMLKDIGCTEALNLDGGGSSCLLINGKETIRPSDGKQRPVPAVWVIRQKR